MGHREQQRYPNLIRRGRWNNETERETTQSRDTYQTRKLRFSINHMERLSIYLLPREGYIKLDKFNKFGAYKYLTVSYHRDGKISFQNSI